MLQQFKPLQPVVAASNSTKNIDVSSWRSQKPLINYELCTNCLICWIYCPEPAIVVDASHRVSIDYVHCKGCGICAVECPRKAIVMEAET